MNEVLSKGYGFDGSGQIKAVEEDLTKQSRFIYHYGQVISLECSLRSRVLEGDTRYQPIFSIQSRFSLGQEVDGTITIGCAINMGSKVGIMNQILMFGVGVYYQDGRAFIHDDYNGKAYVRGNGEYSLSALRLTSFAIQRIANEIASKGYVIYQDVPYART